MPLGAQYQLQNNSSFNGNHRASLEQYTPSVPTQLSEQLLDRSSTVGDPELQLFNQHVPLHYQTQFGDSISWRDAYSEPAINRPYHSQPSAPHSTHFRQDQRLTIPPDRRASGQILNDDITASFGPYHPLGHPSSLSRYEGRHHPQTLPSLPGSSSTLGQAQYATNSLPPPRRLPFMPSIADRPKNNFTPSNVPNFRAASQPHPLSPLPQPTLRSREDREKSANEVKQVTPKRMPARSTRSKKTSVQPEATHKAGKQTGATARTSTSPSTELRGPSTRKRPSAIKKPAPKRKAPTKPVHESLSLPPVDQVPAHEPGELRMLPLPLPPVQPIPIPITISNPSKPQPLQLRPTAEASTQTDPPPPSPPPLPPSPHREPATSPLLLLPQPLQSGSAPASPEEEQAQPQARRVELLRFMTACMADPQFVRLVGDLESLLDVAGRDEG